MQNRGLINLLDQLSGSVQASCIIASFLKEDQTWIRSVWGDLNGEEDQFLNFFENLKQKDQSLQFENFYGFPIKQEHLFQKGFLCIIKSNHLNLSNKELECIAIVKDQIELHLENQWLHQVIHNQNEVILNASRLATLGQMASEIIHEINNPISNIHARLELMATEIKGNKIDHELQLQWLEKMQLNVKRINKIIKGVKSFSRNVDQDPFEDVPVSELIEYSLGFCTERLKYASVILNVDPIPSDLKVNCRKVQISQVIINLVSNSIDATAGMAFRWVKISVHESGDQIIIKVIDSGNGIDSKILEKLFTPFFTTKDKESGTGLGLSISRSIIESHKGSIRYNETTGNTSFLIELPKALQS